MHGQTADQPHPQPTPPTGPQPQPEGRSGARPLSLQDKLQLNRRAKARGLPTLWPEEETQAEREKRISRELRDSLADSLIARQQRDFYGVGLGWPARFWQGGVVGPLHGLRGDANPGVGYGSCWGFGGAFGGGSFVGIDPLSDPQMAAWHSPPVGRFDDSWLGALIWPELACEVGSALAAALRSFFSRFRGPIPW